MPGPSSPTQAEGGLARRGPFLAHDQGQLELAREYLPPRATLWPGNRCALLRDGIEAFPAMLDAIRAAQHYVRLETYMFVDDAVGGLFAEALSSAAERGIEVTVLYDWLGSWKTSRAFFRAMRARGVNVRAFKPFAFRAVSALIRRNHRKVLVIDGELAFVGGINIAAKWAPVGQGEGWRDDVLRIEGPAVRELERCFSVSWRLQVARRLSLLKQRLRRHGREVPAARGELNLAVLSKRRAIYRAYLHAIERARRSVLIAAAYFVPDRRMIDALCDAAGRGVEVRLLLNGKSDHPWLQFATRAFYDRLLAAGATLYEWCHGTLHAKTAVVDGVWGTVGSFNLERMSFAFNYELNVAFADERLGGALEQSFRRDAAMCKPIDPARWRRRSLWRRALERLLFVFRRLI